MTSIQNYWRTQLGWRSPGYHIIVSPDGTATRLASDEVVCNGVAGHNATSLHISYIGGVVGTKAADTRTTAQKATMEEIVTLWKKKHPAAQVLGHRDFPGVKKACPSFDARAWAKSICL